MQQSIPLVDRPADAVLFRLPGRAITAAEFAADARQLADTLPGAPYAANLCTGRYAFAVGFAAALLRGQVSLLTNDRSPDRLRDLLARFPGAIALADGADTGPLPGVTVPPPGNERARIPGIPADRLAALVFTSGSTGAPLVHAKRWGALAERNRDGGVAFGMDAAQPATIVGTVPPQHMYGFETTVLLPMHAACSAWCGPAFYPADIRAALAAVPEDRLLVTTPLQLRALLSDATELPALARIISATAPLDNAMAEAAERQWSTIVSEIFGATEVGSIASRRTTDGAEWTPYAQIRLRARDGELLVEAPGADDHALDDFVELLPDGRFRLLGRRSDVVKMGGRRASLAGLNRELAAVDGVEDGVFVPPDADDHRAAARMTAFVVAPGAAAPAILAALRGRIDPVFLPRRIVHVDRLPRNELGKLPASALQALREAP
ncbi:AMP-binding protein [Acidisphaera sp. L21]|uniref:AMP-binding protein n=1 Tax=Acidisphaera sp. L21 TaxID=1641851 RepID=UPI00131C9124|nr:AMP-binding protein [Acidisphaera sp. L21]